MQTWRINHSRNRSSPAPADQLRPGYRICSFVSGPPPIFTLIHVHTGAQTEMHTHPIMQTQAAAQTPVCTEVIVGTAVLGSSSEWWQQHTATGESYLTTLFVKKYSTTEFALWCCISCNSPSLFTVSHLSPSLFSSLAFSLAPLNCSSRIFFTALHLFSALLLPLLCSVLFTFFFQLFCDFCCRYSTGNLFCGEPLRQQCWDHITQDAYR